MRDADEWWTLREPGSVSFAPVPTPRPKRALVCVTNDLATDQRAHRTCMVLQELGYEVRLVGRKLKGSLPVERPYKTKRFSLAFTRGPAFYAEYNFSLWCLPGFRKYRLVFANDLDTLPGCRLITLFNGGTLVYDAHEYFTEVPELVQRPLVRRVWLILEQLLLPSARLMITVNESIAQEYRTRYRREVHVVRNIPMPRDLGALRTRAELGLPFDKFILVLQGAGINVHRGAEEAVLAMKDLDNALLLIIGGGDAWPTLEHLVNTHGLHDRVRLIGKQPYEHMMQYTRNADLGLTLDKDTNLNYRFSLPNKVFDYLYAGIPVLATDLPEVAAVVRGHDAGVVIGEASSHAIAQAVRTLMKDPERHKALRRNATLAARAFDGEAEKAKLKALLASIGP